MQVKQLEDVAKFSPHAFMRYRLFDTGTMHFNTYCIEPGQQNPLHRHPISDEVLFFVEGTGEVRSGQGKPAVRVQPHSVVWVGKGEPHEIVNTGRTRMLVVLAQAPLPVEHVPVKG